MKRKRQTIAAVCVILVLGSDGGCGAKAAHQPGPDPWKEFSEQELEARIDQAFASIQGGTRRVLLVFIAPWCRDCKEVLRVCGEEPARSVLDDGFVTVYVNSGYGNKHAELRKQYEVERIVTLIVLDEARREVARTTLEPITGGRKLSSNALVKWLRHTSQL